MYHVCGHGRVLCLVYLLYGCLYRCISICTHEAYTKRRVYAGLYSYWDLSYNRTLSGALTFKSERSVNLFRACCILDKCRLNNSTTTNVIFRYTTLSMIWNIQRRARCNAEKKPFHKHDRETIQKVAFHP